MMALMRAFVVLACWPFLAAAQGNLENPPVGATESGVGVISGWHCSAREITVQVDGVSIGKAGSGTERPDTAGVCGGRTSTGFSLLYNYSRPTPGLHRVDVYADGVLLGSRNVVTVRSGGVEFLQGASKEVVADNFPSVGTRSTLTWSQSKQSFVVTSVSTGSVAMAACERTAQLAGRWAITYTIANRFTENLRLLAGPYIETGVSLSPCLIKGFDSEGNNDVVAAYSPELEEWVIVDIGPLYNALYYFRLTTSSRLDGRYSQYYPNGTSSPEYPAFGIKTASAAAPDSIAAARLQPLELETLKLRESSTIEALRLPSAEPDAAEQIRRSVVQLLLQQISADRALSRR